MEAVAGFIITVAFLVLGVALNGRQKDAHRRALTELAAGLQGADVDAERSAVRGLRRGVAITHELTTRGAGSSSTPWTEITVGIGRAPLTLHLVRHRGGDLDAIRAGRMIDVATGHAAFDHAYRIEGGPAAVVARMFPPALVELMLHDECDLEVGDEGMGPRARLGIRGWVDTAEPAGRWWDAIAELPATLARAHAEADAAVPFAVVGSPFRPEVDDRPLRADRERRAGEALAAEATRNSRLDAERARANVIVALTLAIFLAMAAASVLGAR